MTPAKILTNRWLVLCGQRWPDTVRLEETGVGDAVPMAFVHQAVACIEAGNPRAAIPILRKRVKFGVKGKCDLTGWVIQDIGGEKIPRYAEIEIKVGRDVVSDTQKERHIYLREFGAICIIVRDDLEQAAAELAKYAGPGESK
jgi:hypothetical protein